MDTPLARDGTLRKSLGVPFCLCGGVSIPISLVQPTLSAWIMAADYPVPAFSQTRLRPALRDEVATDIRPNRKPAVTVDFGEPDFLGAILPASRQHCIPERALVRHHQLNAPQSVSARTAIYFAVAIESGCRCETPVPSSHRHPQTRVPQG